MQGGHTFDNILTWKRLEKPAGLNAAPLFIPIRRGEMEADGMQACRFAFVHIGDVGCPQDECLTVLW